MSGVGTPGTCGALRRPLVQPEGAPAFGPRRVRNMPPPILVAALASAAIVAVVVALVYAWGGLAG